MSKADIIRNEIKEVLKENYELKKSDCTIHAGTLWKQLKSKYTTIKIDHQEISQVLFSLGKSNKDNNNIVLQNNTKSGGAEVYLSCKFPTVVMFKDRTKVISELRLDYIASNTDVVSRENKHGEIERKIYGSNKAFTESNNGENLYPDEIKETLTCYSEGAKKQVTVNAYERDVRARKVCLKAHGYTCKICGFSFAKKYGEKFQYKIHVHHIKPLSEIQENYEVDPIKDLVPVCPNCHMVLHSKGNGETYSLDEVKEMLV